ncbi:MAG TPA: VOC family protein [Steroidobacteraceae bacterium]|nr:VOC family protein [Steroidobacteraceae bacterium]HNS26713.1 VOC family protein [Steroidobacteraceae bacterium]
MARQAAGGLAKIGQIAIPVSELDRAIVFYRDTLGMRFMFQAPSGLAFFDCGGVRLMLDVAAKSSPEIRSSLLYFSVDDIDANHELLVSRGVEFEAPPHLVAKLPDHELWMAFFRDPDRNLLALMCEKR